MLKDHAWYTIYFNVWTMKTPRPDKRLSLILPRIVSPALIWQRVVSPVLIWQRVVFPVLIWQRGNRGCDQMVVGFTTNGSWIYNYLCIQCLSPLML